MHLAARAGLVDPPPPSYFVCLLAAQLTHTQHSPLPPSPPRIHKLKTESKRAKTVEDQATAAKRKAATRREKGAAAKSAKA